MSRLRIVCHNAFWFQGRPYAPDRPGDARPAILAALVELYRSLDSDVLCLQEIQTAPLLRDLCERLAMDGVYCPGGVLPQYGGALLWRAGRLVADSRATEDPPERMWQIAEIAPVRVANVHLPSSRHLGESRAAARRLEEMAEVVERDRAPDVIAGDFNEQPGGPLGGFLAEHGYADAAELTGKPHLPTTPGGRRNDQIWVARGLRDAVSNYGAASRAEMATDVAGKEHLSDHFPVWIELNLEDTR